MKLRTMFPLFAVVLGMVVLAMPQAASAESGPGPFVDLVCPVGASLSASPGASLLPSHQTLGATLELGSAFSLATPCTSLTGNPQYTGGTLTLVGSGDMGCLGGSARGTAMVTWDNGDISTGTWSVELPIFLLPIITFAVTGGPLTGSHPLGLGLPTGFTGDCVTSPLTHLGGVGVGLLVGL